MSDGFAPRPPERPGVERVRELSHGDSLTAELARRVVADGGPLLDQVASRIEKRASIAGLRHRPCECCLIEPFRRRELDRRLWNHEISYREAARLFNVSKSAVARHFKAHVDERRIASIQEAEALERLDAGPTGTKATVPIVPKGSSPKNSGPRALPRELLEATGATTEVESSDARAWRELVEADRRMLSGFDPPEPAPRVFIGGHRS